MPRRKPSLLELGDSYWAQEYRQREERAMTYLSAQYRKAIKTLEPEWQKAYERLREAQASGLYDQEYLSGLIWSEARLANMLAEAHQQLIRTGYYATTRLTQEDIEAAEMARARVANLLATELTAHGMPPAATASMIHFPASQFDIMAGRTLMGPLAGLANEYGAGAQIIKDTLLMGLATGASPRQVAAMMAKALGAEYGRLETIARTEMLRTYRTATGNMLKANRHLVKGWRWSAAMSTRTCPVCWAMHGTEHDLDEPMETHPVCRCSMKPILRPWSEIDPMLKDVRNPPKPPTGVQLFAKLPADEQRAILGPRAFAAYKEGKLKLPQLVQKTFHPTWGGGLKRRPLREILDKPKRGPRVPKPKPALVEKVTPEPEVIKVRGPLKPKGTPVSAAYDLDALPKRGATGAIGNDIRATADIIDRVHGDGRLPKIPVELTSSKRVHGSYHYRYSRDRFGNLTHEPSMVKMARSADHTRLTFAHETGHFLDQQWFGDKLWYSSKVAGQGNPTVPGMAELMGTIRGSGAVRKLEDMHQAARRRQRWPHAMPDGSIREVMLDSGHLKYVLTDEELFARSYAQYIATRSGDDVMRAELARLTNPTDVYHAKQWADDDFEPIARAFDELFEKNGGLEP